MSNDYVCPGCEMCNPELAAADAAVWDAWVAEEREAIEFWGGWDAYDAYSQAKRDERVAVDWDTVPEYERTFAQNEPRFRGKA